MCVHPNENFKIQQNKTVKMTYIPNMIRVPTYGGDLGHHELHMEESVRITNEATAREERRRKKEGKKKGRCPFIRTSHAE
jgi:hypothetical protein